MQIKAAHRIWFLGAGMPTEPTGTQHHDGKAKPKAYQPDLLASRTSVG
jgi:hypothetical protein